MDETTRISRRDSLLKLGGLLAGATAVGGWKVAEEAGAGPAGSGVGLVTCVLAPEQTEGPYYLDDQKVRRNITEGKRGRPLTLRLTVVDVSTCRAIKGAAVDVWHCDAAGAYSGVAAEPSGDVPARRPARRTRRASRSSGRSTPAGTRGRTVHIHVMVHIGGNVVHTGQLYFPDALTDTVYRRAPYSRRPSRTTRNAADSIYRNGGRRSTLKLDEERLRLRRHDHDGRPAVVEPAMVSAAERERTLAKLREICLAFPETSERLSHGAPTFFVREKRAFLMVLTDHHGDGRFAIWCARRTASRGCWSRPTRSRFFVPPYVGHRGWLGVRLDRGLDWNELAGIAEDAYAEVAPAKLVEARAARSTEDARGRRAPDRSLRL